MQSERSRPEARRGKPSGKLRQAKKQFSRQLVGPLPLSETGQHLATLFPNGWDWIYADAPSKAAKPDWETIKQYPLTPVEMWSLHQDPSSIIGIRPGSITRWGIIDIDAQSRYHPNQNPTALAPILSALEDIGIVRTLINQSSHSGGLHIYIPLPEALSSFSIAVTLKYTLEGVGIKLRPGQCETFPNPKRYIPQGQGFSLYNGIRVPMQPRTGFMPLDDDLNPQPWSLEDWLEAFEQSAQSQDLKQLKRAIADAEHNHRIRGHRNPHSLKSWSHRIDQEKQGWSGPSQTNEKLKLFACEARVFMGMDSERAIAAHIRATAENTPGFYEYSSHTHDLSQRSQDIARWAMRYYWPIGAEANRTTSYHAQAKTVADFSYHQAKQAAAQQRIKQAVEKLQANHQLPQLATARTKAIAAIAHISQQTLYKSINKPLWHPEYVQSITQDLEQAETQSEPEITQQSQKTAKIKQNNQLQPLVNKGITQLFKQVGFVVLSFLIEAAAALTLQGQRAADTALSIVEISEVEAEVTYLPIQGWDELRASLPLSMRQKIEQAELTRQREDELEQKRRFKAEARQRQLKLDLTNQSEDSIDKDCSEDAGIEEPRLEVEQQALARPMGEGQTPLAWEQPEFGEWYELAVQFKLVTDYRWDGQEYQVLSSGQWASFGEMIAIFSSSRLRNYLE
jgi:hypothetical protein